MRRILVNMARRKKADKRGGGRGRLDLDTVGPAAVDRVDDLLAIDEALESLRAADSQAAQLVKFRYFGGLTITSGTTSPSRLRRS